MLNICISILEDENGKVKFKSRWREDEKKNGEGGLYGKRGNFNSGPCFCQAQDYPNTDHSGPESSNHFLLSSTPASSSRPYLSKCGQNAKF